MDGGESQAVTTGRPNRPWPKVHLVYFLLAGFDLIAILGGLFLNHQVIRVFERNVEDFAALDRVMASSWILIDTAADAQAAAADAIITGDTTLSTMTFKGKLHELRQEAARLQSQIQLVLPERAAKRAMVTMARIGSTSADMERTALGIIQNIAESDTAGAVRETAALQARYQELRNAVGDLNQLVAMVKTSNVDQSHLLIKEWRKYQYLIAALIAVIVCCVAAYGLWIGRLMKQKYRELESTNEELAAAQADSGAFAQSLQAINDDVTELNRELAENMRKLGEAEEERVKRGRLADLGQLSAALTRQLRNPLGAIRTSAYLLSRILKDREPDAAPHLARIDNGVVRCDRIIIELLDLSRADSPNLCLHHVDDWIARTVEQEAQRLPANLRFECDLGLGAREAQFDAQWLERAIGHALDSAATALSSNIPSGSSPLIRITSQQTARGVEIAIADNRTASDGAEAGLTKTDFGLLAAERILERHGGGIDREFSPGSGACLTLWFPAVPGMKEVA
ncbi:MAG: HAMP domain-containing histidine kinase [Rhizobiales bacterium]|nr:HAMP domain-containing histidine kinase [Hyphomicrobiales bacterium]